MYVFYVQGGGLGHLTRIDALIRTLNLASEDVLIISPSDFTCYFKDYNFISISWQSNPREWTQKINDVLEQHKVDAFYIDAFPLGIKGELIEVFRSYAELDYIYVSRILKWNTYLEHMPELYFPVFKETIVLEELYANHQDWIIKNSKMVTKLDLSRLKSISEHIKLIESSYILIVHSGGKKDVLELCNKVVEDLKEKSIRVIVFTQVSIKFNDSRFEIKTGVFPVSQYFKYADKIYTAAGFNLINELKPYKSKHEIIAFDKLYDDQFFRKEKVLELI